MRKILSTSLAVIVLTTFTGACFNTHQLAPQELYKLNGFREGQVVVLDAVDGGGVKFSSKTELRIDSESGQTVSAKYSAVEVNGSTLTGTIRGSGAPINIDLAQAMGVQAKSLSVGKTVGLAVGLGVGIPVVVTVTLWAIFVASAFSLTRL